MISLDTAASIAMRLVDYRNWISYYIKRFRSQKMSTFILVRDDNEDEEYRQVTFFGNSLIVYYILNNETNYDWDNLSQRFAKYGINIIDGIEFEHLYGKIQLTYDDDMHEGFFRCESIFDY